MSTSSASLSSPIRPAAEAPASLKNSMIQNRPIAFDATKGSTLCDRIEGIYHQAQTVRTIVGNAASSPARFGCSVVALLSGLGQLYTGNLVTGGVATLAGAKELWNMSTGGPASQLGALLNDIHADVGMIEVLEKSNQESFTSIQNNLSEIRAEIRGLHAQLKEIDQVNATGSAQVQEKKGEAVLLNQEANGAYAHASKLFEAAQEKLSRSSHIYTQCSAFFRQIDALAKNSDPNVSIQQKVDALVQVAEEAVEKCGAGKALLDETAAEMTAAFHALNHAHQLKEYATQSYAQTIQLAEDTLSHTREKAKIKDECEQKVTQTEQEMQKVQEHSSLILRLIQEMKEELKAAKEAAKMLLSPTEAAVGIAGGALLAPLGFLYAFSLGIGATYAYRNGSTISSALGFVTRKVYHWAYGIVPPPVQPMNPRNLTRFAFDSCSSGSYGYFVQRRSSSTVGTLEINLGEGTTLNCRFNLNESRDKLAKEDVLHLYEVMHKKVVEGKMDPHRCLEILQKLESETIVRGPLHAPVTGFIRPTQASYAVFALLKDLCQKRIALTQAVDLKKSVDLTHSWSAKGPQAHLGLRSSSIKSA